MTHTSWGAPGLSRGQLTRVTGVSGLPLYVRSEISPLFQELVKRITRADRLKPGAAPRASAGGYNYRKIAGTNSWSNHAWANAADFNPATNPYKAGPLVTDFVPNKVRADAADLCMRWGGDYSGKKDAMHFEVNTARDMALARVRELQRVGGGQAAAYGVGAKGTKVREVEIRLQLLGHNTGSVDGTYDAATERAVRAFQVQAGFTGKDVDGLVGPMTLKALEFYNLPLGQPGEVSVHGSVLGLGESLLPGQVLLSPNKRTALSMQRDGNLVLRRDGKVTWSTGLRGTNRRLQGDGHLVFYVASYGVEAPVYTTGTTGKGSHFIVQDDGNAVGYAADGTPVFDTGTYVR